MKKRFGQFLFLLSLMLAPACSSTGVVVTGGDLDWKVENDFLIVDFSSNSGTGRSGQLKTIFVKSPEVLLTRGSNSHTIHLSPNLANGEDWVGANRWDPAPEWEVDRNNGVFRLSRSGPMPLVPEIRGTCIYEIRPASRSIRVEESLEALADAEVSLLRLDEWSFVPDDSNPFTHLVWADELLKPHLELRESTRRLPLETAWMGFYSAHLGFGFASVLEEMSWATAGGGQPPLRHQSLRFSGEPHYFYRAFVYPPGEIGEGGPDPVVRISKGDRYQVKYSILIFRGTGDSADEVLGEVVEFHSRWNRELQD